MIISLDEEQAIDNTKYAFSIKFLEYLENTSNIFQIKEIYNQPTVNTMVNEGKQENISLEAKKKTRMLSLFIQCST